jgi:hypothetical protein
VRPVHQTQFYVPPEGAAGDPAKTGNCVAACVASLLELDLADVPNFVAVEGDWWMEFQWWLHKRGWVALELDGDYRWPGYSAASGKSPRGDFKHLVLYLDGKLIHDPHPSGAGIEGEPSYQWILVPLDAGKWTRKPTTRGTT